jgi:pantoate--beta-alanine ligase
MASSTADLGLVQQRIAAWRADRLSIALVPTMGALHRGHCSLIELAAQCSDRVVVSVFINPTQFGKGEDLARYPKDHDGDLRKALGAGADIVWFAQSDQIYPGDFATAIVPSGPAKGLESDHRPQFFGGIATVVARLFGLLRPDRAVFGEKDFQQLRMIEQLKADLAFEVDIIAAPLVRDPDGIASSSRNAYLSKAGRSKAVAVPAALNDACAAFAAGERDATVLQRIGLQRLLEAGLRPDYFALRYAADLQPVNGGLCDDPGRYRFLVAATCDGVRIIDNCRPDAPPWD